jgi:hypothetical protein
MNFGTRRLQHHRFVWSHEGSAKQQSSERNLRNLSNLRILNMRDGHQDRLGLLKFLKSWQRIQIVRN